MSERSEPSGGSDRFGEILDRQYATERQGESERQARGSRTGYGHKRSVRKRMKSRLAR